MFKRALKVAAAFGLLLAGYAGYVQVFAVVASSMRPAKPIASLVVEAGESRTKREAITLAAFNFGDGHWTTERDLSIRFYNAERGYWMYARNYERSADGKRLRFEPFALIWKTRDGKGMKTATSDSAVINLDKPLGLVAKPGDDSALHVIAARLEGDVRLRDNKGTPDPADDLLIARLTYLEYDEPSGQIRSESPVAIRDQDMRTDGVGLQILLRPREAGADGKAAGFNGAQTVFLRRNIHIVMNDVGRSGVVPGGTPTGRADAKAKQDAGPTPLDLRADGEMQIDLPKPKLPVRVGPPAPPAPTIVQFSRNVRVLEGRPKQAPNQLNCDHLKLTLLPPDKPAAGSATPAGSEAAPADSSADASAQSEGSLNGLTMRRADATGHAVWLRSEAQGMKARCNQLIYKVLMPDAPNETYLRGDTSPNPTGSASPKLWVEKLDIVREGPDAGKITSVTTIRTIDATIFDNGQGGDPATVLARGPGLLEVQPARDQPVERSAEWQDQLLLQTTVGPDNLPRKIITLLGDPRFTDTKATLTSHHIIVATLKPKPVAETAKNVAAPPKAGANDPASGAYEIETLVAREDVRMDAPGKTMKARDELDVKFEPAPSGAPAPKPAAGPVVEASPKTEAAPPAELAAAPAAPASEKPAEPNVDVKANRIWARILLVSSERPPAGPAAPSAKQPGDDQKGEIQEVRLRGAVRFHQDPQPGKERGVLVTGEALDVVNLGEGKSKFKVFQQDPSPAAAKRAKDREPGGLVLPLARVETDEFTVEGPKVGLDQSTDRAWVVGAGKLTQLAERGLLTDKGLGETADAPPAAGNAPGRAEKAPTKTTKVPMTIRWNKEMLFRGRVGEPDEEPVGRAEFYGSVVAEMEDALISCQKLTTYMDRPVSLARPPRDTRPAAAAAAGEPEPKPQIAYVECETKVVVISRKVDRPAHLLLQQQRIEGDYLTYDKATGHFHVPGAGKVYLYNREDPNDAGSTPLGGAPRRTVTPTAGPARSAAPRATRAVLGRNTTPTPPDPRLPGRGGRAAAGVGAGPGAGQASAKDRKGLPPLTLTQVTFRKEMRGRFGTGKETDKTERRWADFFGEVEVLHAKVAKTETTIDPDSLPVDFLRLTAETLRVVSEPMPAGSSTPTRNFLTAWERAQATTADTSIQGDKITYDSLKELFYAYGEDGREVNIIHQANIGQPYSGAQGTAAWYNRRTGESQVVDPQQFLLIDPKTGARPQPVKPPKDDDKKKRMRNQLRITPRNNYERKGYTGQ